MAASHDTLELTGTFELDPAHTRMGFAARYSLVTTVRGQFERFSGGATLVADAPERSTAELVLDTASLTTGQQQRDAHLRSPDFFDVDTWPEVLFVSTAVQVVDDRTFRMAGDLTIRDVTRPVDVLFAFHGLALDDGGRVRAGFSGRATLLRSDFGLTYNAALGLGGVLVSDEIDLELDIAAVRTG